MKLPRVVVVRNGESGWRLGGGRRGSGAVAEAGGRGESKEWGLRGWDGDEGLG